MYDNKNPVLPPGISKLDHTHNVSLQKVQPVREIFTFLRFFCITKKLPSRTLFPDFINTVEKLDSKYSYFKS